MSLRYLETLVAVDETGSFSEAANEVCLSQSAVSMQMRALEADLGINLFDRSVRPPALTAAGRQVVTQARLILAQYNALKSDASNPATTPIRIGVVPSASARLLPQALILFRMHHPGAQVRVVSGLSEGLLQETLNRNLDAALITRPGTLPAKLSSRRIERERLLLIGPPDMAASPARTILRDRPLIRFTRAAGVGQIIDTALHEGAYDFTETMELDSLEAILSMVSLGLGVSIVPEGILHTPGASGLRLKTQLFQDPPLVRDTVLVHGNMIAPAMLRGLSRALIRAMIQLRRKARQGRARDI